MPDPGSVLRISIMNEVSLRSLAPEDSMAELTSLLHLAYRPLADAGLHFLATHQSEEVTASRAARGECLVAVVATRLIGTITMVPPGRGRGCPYYERDDVAAVQQFGVHPEYQGRGIGRRLLSLAESRAREMGASIVALDTAETAFGLIAMYRRLGYVEVDQVDWRPKVNYRSVILAKRFE